MNIEIFKNHIELSENEEIYLREKIEHLAKFSLQMEDESVLAKVDILHNKVKNPEKQVVVQVTIDVPHAVIRAEESGSTMEEALNLVYEKLKRQIEKYKNSGKHRTKEGEWIEESTLEEVSEIQNEGVVPSKIQKRKVLKSLTPMTEEEAINNIELVDHDFFVYRDSLDGKLRIVYRRTDGSFGSIEVPE